MLLLFKAILLFMVLVTGYLALFKTQSRIGRRLLGIFLGTVISLFLIFPEYSTLVANVFGIGRGSDFILYLMSGSFVVWAVNLHLAQRKLLSDMSAVVTELSIMDNEIRKLRQEASQSR